MPPPPKKYTLPQRQGALSFVKKNPNRLHIRPTTGVYAITEPLPHINVSKPADAYDCQMPEMAKNEADKKPPAINTDCAVTRPAATVRAPLALRPAPS